MAEWIKKIELKNKNFEEKNFCLLEHQFKIREIFKNKFKNIIGFPDIIVNNNYLYTYGQDNSFLLNTYRDFIKYKNHILFLNIGINFIGIDYIDLKEHFINYTNENSNYFFNLLINNQNINSQFINKKFYCFIEKKDNKYYCEYDRISKNNIIFIENNLDYEKILDCLLENFDTIIN